MKTENQTRKLVLSNYLILLIDSCIVVASVFLAYLLRFNFTIPHTELEPFPKILVFILIVRIGIFLISRSYTGIIKYVTIFDIFKIFLYTTLGSIILLITNMVIYYFINHLLFIPLTIIILEFLVTSFLLFSFRGVIKISYSMSMGKGQLDRLKEGEK